MTALYRRAPKARVPPRDDGHNRSCVAAPALTPRSACPCGAMASGGDGAPKAVAFALKGVAKARPTVAVNGGGGAAQRDFVTAMGDGALDSVAPQTRPSGPLIIPALPNTFETGVGKRPRGVRGAPGSAHTPLAAAS